jgi:hypothetical protein
MTSYKDFKDVKDTLNLELRNQIAFQNENIRALNEVEAKISKQNSIIQDNADLLNNKNKELSNFFNSKESNSKKYGINNDLTSLRWADDSLWWPVKFVKRSVIMLTALFLIMSFSIILYFVTKISYNLYNYLANDSGSLIDLIDINIMREKVLTPVTNELNDMLGIIWDELIMGIWSEIKDLAVKWLISPIMDAVNIIMEPITDFIDIIKGLFAEITPWKPKDVMRNLKSLDIDDIGGLIVEKITDDIIRAIT